MSIEEEAPCTHIGYKGLHREIVGGRRGVFVKTHMCTLRKLTSNYMWKKNANDEQNGKIFFSCNTFVRLRWNGWFYWRGSELVKYNMLFLLFLEDVDFLLLLQVIFFDKFSRSKSIGTSTLSHELISIPPTPTEDVTNRQSIYTAGTFEWHY